MGYDVWDYKYINGVVTVPDYLISNLMVLRSSGFSIMVGEVGFRYCDEYAYIEPYNWNRKSTWNCTATAKYMEQVLNQLNKINPTYIGIWDWNDQTFYIMPSSSSIRSIH